MLRYSFHRHSSASMPRLFIVLALFCLAILAVTFAFAAPQPPRKFAELYYQCVVPHADGTTTWENCVPPVTLNIKGAAVGGTLRQMEQPGRTIDDVPDDLKLNAEQQKAVDSFAPPLSAIAVTCNGMALSLFIQLDADHLFRADPRQSDMFTAVKGKMVQSKAPPMEWKVAYALAEKAVLSTHVVVPCAEDPAI